MSIVSLEDVTHVAYVKLLVGIDEVMCIAHDNWPCRRNLAVHLHGLR